MKYNKAIIVLFLITIFTVPVISLIVKDNEISLVENRALVQASKLKYSGFSEFLSKLESYVVDQFPKRELFLKIYTRLELLFQKKYVRNTYVASEQWLLPNEYVANKDSINNYIISINKIVNKYKNTNFYYAILPNKTSVLNDLDSKYIDKTVGAKNKQSLQLINVHNLTVIDVSNYFENNFNLEELKKMYFKTDFHWNALGAYQAANYIQTVMFKKKSIHQKFSKSDFYFNDLKNHTYQGDLNMRFSNIFSTNELIPIVAIKDISKLKYYKSINKNKLVNREDIVKSKADKQCVNYNDIYTYNLGYYHVENQNSKNKNCILIFKDSLQNPSIDMFTQLFRDVYVIDPRFYNESYNIHELIKTLNPNIVLFMYHQNNFSMELTKFLSTTK